MIDIIIQTKKNNLNLEKTLLSIYLQEIDVPYKVTIISKNINNNIINKFNNWFPINCVEVDNQDNIKEIALKYTSEPYIVFIDSNTLFYNVESLKKLYNKIIKEDKNIFGKTLVNGNNTQDSLKGNIFKRKTLKSSENESISNLICISNEKE